MKKEVYLVAAVLLLLMLVTSPLTTFAGNGISPTTTLPSYTTTTTRICGHCSYDPPATPEPTTTTSTTTTRRVGPSGGYPPYSETTTPTTTSCTCLFTSSVMTETTTTNTTHREGPSGGPPSNFETTVWTTTTTGYVCSCSTHTTWPQTTTSGNLCVTNTTFPPTTTTTLSLTGPDGTAPTTNSPTTGPSGALCRYSVDLLSTSNIATSEHMSMLGDPYGGYWLCCDCYSHNGETVTVFPVNGSEWALPNLHLTVCSNVAFSVKINGLEESTAWVAQRMGGDSGIMAAGSYVVSLDLYDMYAAFGEIPQAVAVTEVEITLHAPGSVSVGHLALSDKDFCSEPPPRIQTTTIPKFPWDTTTTTEPTTNPTVDDVFYPGDVDDDWMVTTRDARVILRYTVGDVQLSNRHLFNADFNFDGNVNTADVRDILFMLTA